MRIMASHYAPNARPPTFEGRYGLNSLEYLTANQMKPLM
jgi:hypothetical protein